MSMNSPWGHGPSMMPPWWFTPQQPSDITFEQKLRIHEDVKAYEKRLRDEIKAEESKGKDKEKKEEKKKMWYDRTPLEIGLFMFVTFPFWGTGMVNAYSAAFKSLGVALSVH